MYFSLRGKVMPIFDGSLLSGKLAFPFQYKSEIR